MQKIDTFVALIACTTLYSLAFLDRTESGCKNSVAFERISRFLVKSTLSCVRRLFAVTVSG